MTRSLFASILGVGSALMLLAGLVLLVRPVQAATDFDVDDTGDAGDANPGDGACATAGGVCTLRAAVEESNALAGADTIRFDAAILPGTITLGQTLVVSDDLTITGPGALQLTISGDNAVRLLELWPGNTIEIGFLTLFAGNTNTSGAGIYNEATLTLRRVTMERHLAAAGRGAALYNAGGAVAINGSTINSNHALSGGGVANEDGTMTLTGVLLTDNSVDRNGAAIYQNGVGATMVISDGVTITANQAPTGGAQGFGGGAYIHAGSATFVGATVSANLAQRGGGVYLRAGSANLVDTTVFSNTAQEGGGIYSQGNLSVQNSLIDNNEAELGGGGIFTAQGAGSQSLILDSEIAYNSVVTDALFSTYGGGGLRLDASHNVARRLNVHHNSAGYDGGGIGIWYGTAYLEEIDFSHNDGGFKGGALANYGQTTLVASTLYSNTSQAGSAIHNDANYGPNPGDVAGPGQLLIQATTIISNASSYYAGAIGNGGKLDMYDSLVQGNTVGDTNNGGGFSNFPGGIAGIYNSTFAGNVAGWNGGAIANSERMTVTNSTFSGNHAQRGGAIAVFDDFDGSNSTFTHVTIHDNTATIGGGGIWQKTVTNTVVFVNSIVAGNTGDDCDVVNLTVPLANWNMDGDGSCDNPDFNLTANPLFGPLADNGGPTPTHALGAGSPAVDVVLANCDWYGANDRDQRGVVRPAAACDLGAYEYDAAPVCALPAPLADLGIALAGDIVSLDWSASPGAGLYHVLRENDPYFGPGDLYGLTAALAWDDPDPDAAGDPQNNHYYMVVPSVPCGDGAISNRVGVFNFGLTPGS